MTATGYATMRKSTNPVVALMSDGWDPGDPWGSGMSALGAVCDVLNALGERHLVDPGAGYVPAPYSPTPTIDDLATEEEDGDEPWDTVSLAIQVRDGLIDTEDLRRACRIFHLYLNLVLAAGKDY